MTSAEPVLALLPESQILVDEAAGAWCRGFPAEGVVFPASVEETQALVRVANETGTRLLPAGCGGWLGAGGWTRGGGVVVSTARMDAVHHYEPADLTLTAGAGLGFGELAGVLKRNGQWLPLDGPGCDAGTLGAAVACGVSGPLGARYGAARDNVLGLEVVTGDGRVLRIGGRVVKNVAGYDLVRLFSGSRGSLGVITSVSVRLFPRPQADLTLLFGGEAEEVVAMARAVCTSALPVAAAEVVEGTGGVAGGAMALAVRILGGPDEAEDVCTRIAACAGAGPGVVLVDAQSEDFHAARVGWEGDSPIVVRLAALPSELGRTLERAGAIASAVEGELSAHALHGIVRVKGSRVPDGVDALAAQLSRIRGEVEESGGTMTLSQAPAELAARVGWTGDGGNESELARRIKALFDPTSMLSAECS